MVETALGVRRRHFGVESVERRGILLDLPGRRVERPRDLDELRRVVSLVEEILVELSDVRRVPLKDHRLLFKPLPFVGDLREPALLQDLIRLQKLDGSINVLLEA